MNVPLKAGPWMFQVMSQPKVRKARQTFTTAEDQALTQLVQTLGEYDWNTIAQKLPGRTPRQCRDRWKGYLSPSLSSEEWTHQEDQQLIDEYNKHGPRWSRISNFIKGRSEVAVKNRWKLLFRRSKGTIVNRAIEEPVDEKPITIPVRANAVSLPMPDFMVGKPTNRKDLEAFFDSLQCSRLLERPTQVI